MARDRMAELCQQGHPRPHLHALLPGINTFPNEIWQYIVDLTSRTPDLQNLALTCQTFRCMVQPILCSVFCVRLPQAPVTTPERKITRVSWRFHKRLEFFSSNRIAPHVRALELCSDGDFPLEDETEGAWEFGLRMAIENPFHCTPRFVNVRQLTITNIVLSPKNIHHASLLPNLTDLALHGCPTINPTNWESCEPQFKLKSLTIDSHIHNFGYSIEWFQYVVSPDTIEVIDAPGDFFSPLINFLSVSPTMQALRVLKISASVVDFVLPEVFVSAMKNCCHLEELRLVIFDKLYPEQNRSHPPLLLSHVLPRLRTLHAPYKFISAYLPNRRIRGIGVVVDLIGDFQVTEFLNQTREDCPKLAHLTIGLQPSIDLLETILTHFRALQTLTVTFSSLDETFMTKASCKKKLTPSSRLLALLFTATLPQTLQTLTILTKVMDKDRKDVEHERIVLSSRLQREYPKLEFLSIDGQKSYFSLDFSSP